MRFDARARRRARAAVGATMVASALLLHVLGPSAAQDVPPGERETLQLDGELDLHFDPWTLNPVVPPRALEFKMEQVATTERGPNHSIAVNVRQTSQASAAVNTESVNRYILDPETRRNLDSDEAWAYDPANVVDRAPAYSLSLPPGFDPTGSYPWFEPTTDSIQDLEPTGEEPEVAGVGLVAFEAEVEGTASRAYLMNLALFGLPTTLTPEDVYRMSPRPTIDRTAVQNLRAALPSLPVELRSRIEDTLNTAIPVSYQVDGTLAFDFEPRTGALVRVREVTHLLVAHVDLSGLEAVRAALLSWEDPRGAQLAAQLGGLDAMTELPVFTYDLAQTEASVAAMARRVQGDLRTLAVLGIWLPSLLALAGLAILGMAMRRRRACRPTEADHDDADTRADGNPMARDEAAASQVAESQPAAAASRQSSRGESDQSFSNL